MGGHTSPPGIMATWPGGTLGAHEGATLLTVLAVPHIVDLFLALGAADDLVAVLFTIAAGGGMWGEERACKRV